MNSSREMTCIVCPNGCMLTVEAGGCEPQVSGALCKKGVEYARMELLNPVRTLATTVKVTGGELPLASVRTVKPIPKALLRQAVELISQITLEAPVAFHQVVFRDLLGTGADVVATREIQKQEGDAPWQT
jgi:CxxC motif-containing protein